MTKRQNLLLLPGLLCDEALWAHQTAHLADLADIQVADFAAGDPPQDSLGEMARRALAAAPERFALAGLSMGGYVAQEIMRQAPERVTRLALLDTSPLADTPEQRRRRQGLMALARTGKFRGVTEKILPMFLPEDRLGDKALTGEIMAMAERVGREAFLAQQQAIQDRPDSRPDLAKVTCATLVVCGRLDALTPLARAEEIADAVPGAALVVIENCGHMATMERPEAVTALMRYWLQI